MEFDRGRVWINAVKFAWAEGLTHAALLSGKLKKAVAEIPDANPSWRIIRFSRVIDTKKYPHPISTENFITPKQLEANLRFAAKEFPCLSLSKLIQRVSSGKQPERGTVCFTFDGGWVEHLNIVAPLLRDLNLTSAFFIPTGFVGTNELFWEDKTIVILQILKLAGRPLPIFSAFTSEQNDALAQLGKGVTIEKIFFVIEVIKQMDPLAKMVTLNEITQSAAGLGTIPIDRYFMNWDEILALKKSGVAELGSLTDNHYDITQLIKEEFVTEIHKSFSALRNNGIEPLQVLAIPHGKYTPDNALWFDMAGIPTVLSYSMGGIVGKSRSTLLLDRVNFSQGNQKTFWLKAWGVIN